MKTFWTCKQPHDIIQDIEDLRQAIRKHACTPDPIPLPIELPESFIIAIRQLQALEDQKDSIHTVAIEAPCHKKEAKNKW